MVWYACRIRCIVYMEVVLTLAKSIMTGCHWCEQLVSKVASVKIDCKQFYQRGRKNGKRKLILYFQIIVRHVPMYCYDVPMLLSGRIQIRELRNNYLSMNI